MSSPGCRCPLDVNVVQFSEVQRVRSSLRPVRPSQLAVESLESTPRRLQTKSGLVLPPLWEDFSCRTEGDGQAPAAADVVACDEALGESSAPQSDCDSLFQASTLEDNLSLDGIKCTVPPKRRDNHYSWYEWESMFDDYGSGMCSKSRLRYPLRSSLPPTSERWRPQPPQLIAGRRGEDLNGNPPSTPSRNWVVDSSDELRVPPWSPLPTRPVTPKLATSARSGRERRSGGGNDVGAQRLPRSRRLEVIADDVSRPSSAAAAMRSARSTKVIRRPHSTVMTAGVPSSFEVNVWDWDKVSTPPHGSLIPDLPAEPDDSMEPGWESRCFATSGLPAIPEQFVSAGRRRLYAEGNAAQSSTRPRCMRELLQ